MTKHQGFTLIELMVSIALGLLVVAAGLSLYLASQRSMNLQNGLGELQQNAIFGLSTLTHDLRHTNLNTASTQRINNKIAGSGIVFAEGNLPTGLSGVNSNLFTRQDSGADATDGMSDQLTIQFIPQYREVRGIQVDEGGDPDSVADKTESPTLTATTDMFDCEGRNTVDNTVVGDDADSLVVVKRVIVQRYYLEEMFKGSQSYSPRRFALYCDAGSYDPDDDNDEIEGLGTGGQQIIQNIDAFKVMLGVQAQNGGMRYMTINEYTAFMDDDIAEENYLNVVSVSVAVLAHSSNPVAGDEFIDNSRIFNLFANKDIPSETEGEPATSGYGAVSLVGDDRRESKFIRQVFSQVVAFRNTLGGEWE